MEMLISTFVPIPGQEVRKQTKKPNLLTLNT